MLDASGRVRPHWQALARELAAATPAQMRRRHELLERTIRENGVTYNIYADPKGEDRPWHLDLLPNLISAAEWEQVVAGVSQRAQLLNAVLADLYGPQTLLRKGLLPPELVFGHNNFLWSCEGVKPPGEVFLHFYAADLSRAVDGTWWLVSDRTQAPSGAGYALENRAILSQAFPDLLHTQPVHSLGGFFTEWIEAVRALAPVGPDETALIVLLTPGRFNETYFEHVYLARHLGLPLVEGSDLTVRGGEVFLKTLYGLRRVHAILRRIDDDFCDPLELRGDSRLGVPGLVEAVRAGNVLVTNALGSGVLESPGVLGFLPAISERLLGEKLKLPSVATWWCGEAPVREAALQQLDRLVLKPAFPSQRTEPVFGHALDAAQLEEWRDRIRQCPAAYVAQELLQLSHAPIYERHGAAHGQLPTRAIGMRVFAAWTPNGYRVMPGALTRVAGDAHANVVSMQRGGGSKDTWVLGEAPARPGTSLRRVIGAREVARTDPYLASRVVENLYWLGRYCERADNTARLLRAVIARWLENSPVSGLPFVLRVAQCFELLEPDAPLREGLHRGFADPRHPESLRSALDCAAWAGAQVRGRLSQDNWRSLVDLQRQAHAMESSGKEPGAMLEQLGRMMLSLSALTGFAHDDMTRDDGWRMLLVGRLVERVQYFSSVLAFLLRDPSADEVATLGVILELANSTITYRMRYHTSPQLLPVIDLAGLDETNPHSVRYQVLALDEQCAKLPVEAGSELMLRLAEMSQLLADCSLDGLEPGQLFGESQRAAARAAWAGLFERVHAAGMGLSELLSARFFSHIDDVGQATVST